MSVAVRLNVVTADCQAVRSTPDFVTSVVTGGVTSALTVKVTPVEAFTVEVSTLPALSSDQNLST